MGIEPPFLYDPVKTDYTFDPKAISRASLSPPPPRPKRPEGPLVSFNQHPDSYLIVPHGNAGVQHMDPSVKKNVKWTRLALLGLRSIQLLGAAALLVMMILISGVDAATGWIMRIAPGVAILHTVYGVYHLGRHPGGRTPGSSASYMLFASFFDVSIVPFYAFSALVAKTRPSGWTTLLSNQSLLPAFINVVFYTATVAGAFHLISLTISLYLAVTFRKITKLPPDMNPLEDNLTSRHKRNKSSISTITTSPSEKRLSEVEPFENRRRSGAPYEDLSRPPTIPFFHTRSGSSDSNQSKQSSPRNSRTGSPARYNANNPSMHSPRHSVADTKRASVVSSSSKRASQHSYTSLPVSENLSYHTAEEPKEDKAKDPWFTNDSIGKNGARSAQAPRSRPNSPKKSSTSASIKSSYHPLPLEPSDFDEYENENYQYHLPNPLAENPPTPRPHIPSSSSTYSAQPVEQQKQGTTSTKTIDITDDHANSFDWPLRSPDIRELTPKPLRTRGSGESFKAMSYGQLKSGTPPLIVGGNRQVSSGVDLGIPRDRDVSGKIAEEGRGGQWGARFRKISGLSGIQIM